MLPGVSLREIADLRRRSLRQPAVGAGNEIYLLEGKPDLNGALWKVAWNGQGLVRIGAGIPMLYNPSYQRSSAGNQFDVSPDGRHLAFQTQPVLEKNIGMIENVR
jgi:hypothetical protein